MSTAILSEEPYVFFKYCPRRTVTITVCGVCVCVCVCGGVDKVGEFGEKC